MMLSLALLLLLHADPTPDGPWRAVLDLAGGTLRFGLTLDGRTGVVCNGSDCDSLSSVTLRGDSVELGMADYDARIVAAVRGDSLSGYYHNVGNRGPRTIPFRAARGTWDFAGATPALEGSWDATFKSGERTSPRVLRFWDTPQGMEGTIISNSGDYGRFWGSTEGDGFTLSHFDGSFVYHLTGRLEGDTLRGTFHAGLRSQTPWVAVRTTGRPHLTAPSEVTRTDSLARFTFAFPGLDGQVVTQDDPRLAGRVVIVDIFGTWCPTCHDAAPLLVDLHREYGPQGLAIVGLAYEVTGDTAVDHRQLRRYREKFGIEFPLLLAGVNDTELTAATLPQLENFTAYPTTLFLDRQGRVRRIHAGFYGPATGAQHDRLVQEFRGEVERLLAEPDTAGP